MLRLAHRANAEYAVQVQCKTFWRRKEYWVPLCAFHSLYFHLRDKFGDTFPVSYRDPLIFDNLKYAKDVFREVERYYDIHAHEWEPVA